MTPSTLRELTIIWQPPVLHENDPVRHAVLELLQSGLPALPVVDADGSFAGIFGEREFMAALFPGYLGELSSARFVTKSVDELLERRSESAVQPIAQFINRDHVDVRPDPADALIAEIFLHHRVLIVPLVEDRRPIGLVTRSDFFRALAERFLGVADGDRPGGASSA